MNSDARLLVRHQFALRSSCNWSTQSRFAMVLVSPRVNAELVTKFHIALPGRLDYSNYTFLYHEIMKIVTVLWKMGQFSQYSNNCWYVIMKKWIVTCLYACMSKKSWKIFTNNRGRNPVLKVHSEREIFIFCVSVLVFHLGQVRQYWQKTGRWPVLAREAGGLRREVHDVVISVYA
jgi:hypothetical protein